MKQMMMRNDDDRDMGILQKVLPNNYSYPHILYYLLTLPFNIIHRKKKLFYLLIKKGKIMTHTKKTNYFTHKHHYIIIRYIYHNQTHKKT